MAVAREFNPVVSDDAPDPYRWGRPEEVRQMFERLSCDVRIQRRSLTFRYPSWDEWRRAGEVHGMAVMARRMMEPDRYEEMRRRMQAVTAEHDHGDGDTVAFDSEYLEIIVRKD